MTLEPILTTTLAIQVHILAALPALLLGPIALWRKRRDRVHKVVGYIWVVAMAATAFTSFFIPSEFTSIGVGPIHALSVYGLWGLFLAMHAIFEGNVKLHKQVMTNIYVRGVAIAGAFNFLPGRTMQRVLIPDQHVIGYVIVAVTLLWVFWPVIGRLQRVQVS